MKSWSLPVLFSLSLFPLASGASAKRAWDSISNPLRMDANERNFARLPLSGRATANPLRYWSSDYWAKKKGGINYRWNAPRPAGLNLRSPAREEVLHMSPEQLAQLAPSEKLDLLSGAYDYPLKREIARYANPAAPEWEGICNGWAQASSNHDEPKPITLVNADGVQIPFGSSDVKALLSWYYFRRPAVDYSRMGGRCRNKADETCDQDLNAGAFHLVLSNRLGLKGEGFTADIDRYKEVWNHTATGYQSRITNNRVPRRYGRARGTARHVRVKTIVDYTFVLKKNSWEPVLGTVNQRSTKRTYEYYLDLDASGAIIGGDWITAERPDFLWSTGRATEFTGNMEKLGEIVTALGI
jgi:hypothetical protein